MEICLFNENVLLAIHWLALLQGSVRFYADQVCVEKVIYLHMAGQK